MTTINEQIPTERGEKYIAGDTAVLNVTITNEGGSPMSLDDVDVTFALANFRGGDPIIEKSLGDGITVTNEDDGKMEVRVKPEDTLNLGSSDGRKHYYEITLRRSDGESGTVTTGNWMIYSNTASF